MLNAQFKKNFKRMYHIDEPSERQLLPRYTLQCQVAASEMNRNQMQNGRNGLPRRSATPPRALPERRNMLDRGNSDTSSVSLARWGNCRRCMNRTSSNASRGYRHDLNGHTRRRGKEGMYRRRMPTPSDGSESDEMERLPYRGRRGQSSSSSNEVKPKYDPKQEGWPKRSDNNNDRRWVDGNRAESGGSGHMSPIMREWVSWRCCLNQGLAKTVLTSRSAPIAVRTIDATPEFSQRIVESILDDYACRIEKPPTTLHENDYLMFGIPRVQLKSQPSTPKEVLTRNMSNLSNVSHASHFKKLGNVNRGLHSFAVQKIVAQKAKEAESRCLPSLRWKPKKNKVQKQSNSEPEYLPSAKQKRNQMRSSFYEKSSAGEETEQARFVIARPYCSWRPLARPRDRMALPPESGFLARPTSSEMSYWSTSSTSLSLTSVSDSDTDSFISSSESASSGYTSRPSDPCCPSATKR